MNNPETPDTPTPADGVTLTERVALVAFQSLLVGYGERHTSAAGAELLASAAWEYARAWMAVRGRETFLPKIRTAEGGGL